MKTNLLLNLVFVLALSGLSSSLMATADVSASQKGYAIAAESDRSDRGFRDSEVKMTMIMRTGAGDESVRELLQRTLEQENEDIGDRSLIIFDKPADIDGTALLSHAKIIEADDQWLYLPAFKRVKRISSVNKDGAFVGSEFSYEDFTALELNKFSYIFLRDEQCGEQLCALVERLPKYAHSGYSKQIAWIDYENKQPRKVEFYDRRGDLLKTLSLEDYRQYEGKYWRAHKLVMVNEKTKKSTDLLFSDFRFQNGFAAKDFEKGVLNRIR
jgi:Outer membrane lipoprotein-sorting protein